MPQSNSIAPGSANKPNKPYPEFALRPHVTKRRVKKIRGKMHDFEPWNDPDGAQEVFE